MPNHVTNIIRASDKVLDALSGPDDPVDFNSIIPMPRSLHDVQVDGTQNLVALLFGDYNDLMETPSTEGSETTLGWTIAELQISNVLRDLRKNRLARCSHKEFENFMTMLRNRREHGVTDWYSFGVDRWGTKWNAYDADRGVGEVRFDTAWSAPHPVIKALVARFPNERIEHLWADEDIGQNYGHVIYDNGEQTNCKIDDPIDFALTVKNSDRDYYRQNPDTGMWEYFDDEDEDWAA